MIGGVWLQSRNISIINPSAGTGNDEFAWSYFMAISKDSTGRIFITIYWNRGDRASLFNNDHSFLTISYLVTWYSEIKTIAIKRAKLHQFSV